MIDIAFKNNLEPKKGRILLSDPFERDAYFKRSVVYLCNHDNEGSFGFVLNNTIQIILNQLNPEFPAVPIHLHLGGPVDTQTMFFIHRMSHKIKNATQLDDTWFLGGDYTDLFENLNRKHIQNNDIHFFLGYSGWSEGQLTEELEDNSWVVAEINNFEEILTTSKSDLWKFNMEKLGEKFKWISNFPLDPTNN